MGVEEQRMFFFIFIGVKRWLLNQFKALDMLDRQTDRNFIYPEGIQ